MSTSRLYDRLAAAILSPGPPVRIRPHVRIPTASGGSLSVAQLVNLLDLLGCSGEPLIAGWWSGDNLVGELDDIFGDPVEQVSLVPASDLEWRVWESEARLVVAATAVSRTGPGLLTTLTPRGWVLVTAPTEFHACLYVEEV